MNVENVHILKCQIFFPFIFTKIFRMHNTSPNIYILLFMLKRTKDQNLLLRKRVTVLSVLCELLRCILYIHKISLVSLGNPCTSKGLTHVTGRNLIGQYTLNVDRGIFHMYMAINLIWNKSTLTS